MAEEEEEERHKMPDFPNEAKKCYRSMVAHKGHLTRRVKDILKSMDLLESVPAKSNIDMLKNDIERLAEQTTKFEDSSAELIQADPDYEDYWVKEEFRVLDSLGKDVDAAKKVMALAEKEIRPKDKDGEALVKVDQQTRPIKLVHNAKPETFMEWRKMARRYWTNTLLDTKSRQTQYSTIYTMMDSLLIKALETKTKRPDGTQFPVFAADDAQPPSLRVVKADSAMKVLEEHFLKNNPVNRRRVDFRQHQHIKTSGKPMTVSMWMIEQWPKSEEAYLLDGMTHDEIMVEHLFYYVKDSALEDELYKVKDPTWQKLQAVVNQWEERHTYKPDVFTRQEHVRNVKNRSHKNGQNGHRDRNNGRNQGRNGRSQSRGPRRNDQNGKKRRCWHCAARYDPSDPKAHNPRTCFAKDKTCRHCNGPNHISDACFLQAEMKKSSNSGRKQNGGPKKHKNKDRGRSASRGPPQSRASSANSADWVADTCYTVEHKPRTKCMNKGIMKKSLIKLADKKWLERGKLCLQVKMNADVIERKIKEHQEAERYAYESPICRKSFDLPPIKLKISPQRDDGQDFEMDGTPDTGCSRMLCGPEIPAQYGYKINKYKTTPPFLYTASDECVPTLGQIDVIVEANGVSIAMPIIVLERAGDRILVSFRDLIDFKALPPNFPQRYEETSSTKEQAAEVKEKPMDKISLELRLKTRLENLNRNYRATVFSGEIKSIIGEPQKLVIDEELLKRDPPRKCTTARQCPKHLQAGAAEQIKKMLSNGVIMKIPNDEVTPVVCPMGFTPKKTPGKVRVYSDLKEANKYLIRSPHPIPKIKDLMHDIPAGSKVFATFDLADGFYQVDLHPDSMKYTCCICPQLGDMPAFKLVYKKAPQGLRTSSDSFCERTDKALGHCDGLLKYVDDCLLVAENEKQLFERIEAFYQACEKANIGLNEDKNVIGTEVAFAGMVINEDGIRPDPKRLAAIRDAPAPKDLTSLRSFLGVVNTLLIYRSDLSQLLRPLHYLTKKGHAFIWTADAQHAFEQCKMAICNGPDMLIEPFDPKYTLELHCDASLRGLGYNVIGRGEDGKGHLVQAGSRAISDTESRYEMISLELLAVAFAAEKAKYLLLGSPRPITVFTDCRSLIGLMKKPLDKIDNNRLLRLRQKLDRFPLIFKHVEGKKNCVPDWLSRYPTGKPDAKDIKLANELTLAVCNEHLAYRLANDPNMETLVIAAGNDVTYQKVRDAILAHENLEDLPGDHPAKVLKKDWDKLSVEDELIIYDCNKILIPRQARAHLLDLVHKPHAGLVRSMALCKRYYFWPGMKNDVETMINQCEICQERRQAQPEEPMRRKYPCDGPGDIMSIDMMTHDKTDYLVGVDRWSFFPFVEKMKRTASDDVIKVLRKWWGEYGTVKVLHSDNARNFVSETFEDFLKEQNVLHTTSSPYHPRSNHSERAIREVKGLIIKYDGKWNEICDALNYYRDMPRSDIEASPSELFLGRQLRTKLPMWPGAGLTSVEAHNKRKALKCKREDMSEEDAVKESKPLRIGDKVRVYDALEKKWMWKARIIGIREEGRSFIIEDERRRKYVRNRKFLKLLDRSVSFDLSESTDKKAIKNDKSEISQLTRKRKTKEEIVEPRRSKRLKEKMNNANKMSFCSDKRPVSKMSKFSSPDASGGATSAYSTKLRTPTTESIVTTTASLSDTDSSSSASSTSTVIAACEDVGSGCTPVISSPHHHPHLHHKTNTRLSTFEIHLSRHSQFEVSKKENQTILFQLPHRRVQSVTRVSVRSICPRRALSLDIRPRLPILHTFQGLEYIIRQKLDQRESRLKRESLCKSKDLRQEFLGLEKVRSWQGQAASGQERRPSRPNLLALPDLRISPSKEDQNLRVIKNSRKRLKSSERNSTLWPPESGDWMPTTAGWKESLSKLEDDCDSSGFLEQNSAVTISLKETTAREAPEAERSPWIKEGSCCVTTFWPQQPISPMQSTRPKGWTETSPRSPRTRSACRSTQYISSTTVLDQQQESQIRRVGQSQGTSYWEPSPSSSLKLRRSLPCKQSPSSRASLKINKSGMGFNDGSAFDGQHHDDPPDVEAASKDGSRHEEKMDVKLVAVVTLVGLIKVGLLAISLVGLTLVIHRLSDMLGHDGHSLGQQGQRNDGGHLRNRDANPEMLLTNDLSPGISRKAHDPNLDRSEVYKHRREWEGARGWDSGLEKAAEAVVEHGEARDKGPSKRQKRFSFEDAVNTMRGIRKADEWFRGRSTSFCNGVGYPAPFYPTIRARKWADVCRVEGSSISKQDRQDVFKEVNEDKKEMKDDMAEDDDDEDEDNQEFAAMTDTFEEKFQESEIIVEDEDTNTSFIVKFRHWQSEAQKDAVATVLNIFGVSSAAIKTHPPDVMVRKMLPVNWLDKWLINIGLPFVRVFYPSIPENFEADSPPRRYKRNPDETYNYYDYSWVNIHGRAAGIIIVTISACIFMAFGYCLLHLGCCGCATIFDLCDRCRGRNNSSNRRQNARDETITTELEDLTNTSPAPAQTRSEDRGGEKRRTQEDLIERRQQQQQAPKG